MKNWPFSNQHHLLRHIQPLLALFALLPALGLGWASASRAAAQPIAAEQLVYLPFVGNGATSANPGPTPPPPPPPAKVRGALYFDKTIKTKSASAAVDQNGGMHVALALSSPYNEHPPAVYLACTASPAACADPNNWSGVSMGDFVDEAILALTPAGQPRVLFRSWQSEDGGNDFFYAACDQDCTRPDGWAVTFVAHTYGTSMNDISRDQNPHRYFALDHLGRPRFVYYDRNYRIEPDHFGVFYAYCDDNCTSQASWRETQIGANTNYDAELFDKPALTFTSQGQPRVVAQVFGFGGAEGIFYVACDDGCESPDGWGRARIADRGQGPYISMDIAVDQQDRPRIVFYQASMADGSGEQLSYFWCDASCLDGANWGRNSLGLGKQNGQQPDLEIDSQGRPRIAWVSWTGDLGYSWCDAACQTGQPQWQSQVVETTEAMEQANPQAIPPHCDQDVWKGLAPTLSLDRQGNPRIAFDVSVNARCHYDDTPGDPTDPPSIRFSTIWRAARYLFFEQP